MHCCQCSSQCGKKNNPQMTLSMRQPGKHGDCQNAKGHLFCHLQTHAGCVFMLHTSIWEDRQYLQQNSIKALLACFFLGWLHHSSEKVCKSYHQESVIFLLPHHFIYARYFHGEKKNQMQYSYLNWDYILYSTFSSVLFIFLQISGIYCTSLPERK